MVLQLLRFGLTFIFPAFYRRIQARNTGVLHQGQPMILAMNHPNAFTDAMVITYVTFPLRFGYIARGDVFKPGIATWFLRALGIIPIFRIQDAGKEGLSKNDEGYRIAFDHLKGNKKLIVFAEGLCIQEKHLRPLKKGVARLAYGALRELEGRDVLIVPVGVNYSKADKFRSDVFYNFGEPLSAKAFFSGTDSVSRQSRLLLESLERKMSEALVDVNDRDRLEMFDYAEKLLSAKMLGEKNLDAGKLEDCFVVSKEIAERINNILPEKKPEIDSFAAEAGTYFRRLHKNKLRDWLIDPAQNKNVKWTIALVRTALLFTGLPIYLLAYLLHILPLALVNLITKKIVRNREFFSSVAIAGGEIIFCLWYLLLFLICSTIGWNAPGTIVILLVSGLCAWFALHFHEFALKTFGMIRVLRNKQLFREFSEERAALLSALNKF
jgi:1-acyl-sn-glycerol-3-phosphate acyltransferase